MMNFVRKKFVSNETGAGIWQYDFSVKAMVRVMLKVCNHVITQEQDLLVFADDKHGRLLPNNYCYSGYRNTEIYFQVP